MAEILIQFDPLDILERSKKILRDQNELPVDCPSPDNCLRLSEVQLSLGQILVKLDASPPQLPTTRDWMRYDIHETCGTRCGIYGNSNRRFRIIQNSVTGEVRKAQGEWKSES